MAIHIEIKCVNKSNRMSAHERILFIGGINPDGQRWKLSQEAAIDGIERGEWEFFVQRGIIGGSVKVIIAISRYGNKYLKTASDGEHPNNLLSLPECPP